MDRSEDKAVDLSKHFGITNAVRAGQFLFLSGQIGMDAQGNVPADPEAQFRLAFDALSQVLAAEGCDKTQIVELTTFHRNYPDNLDVFMKVKDEYLAGTKTAWTAVGVTGVGVEESLVEVKAIVWIG